MPAKLSKFLKIMVLFTEVRQGEDVRTEYYFNFPGQEDVVTVDFAGAAVGIVSVKDLQAIPYSDDRVFCTAQFHKPLGEESPLSGITIETRRRKGERRPLNSHGLVERSLSSSTGLVAISDKTPSAMFHALDGSSLKVGIDRRSREEIEAEVEYLLR